MSVGDRLASPPERQRARKRVIAAVEQGCSLMLRAERPTMEESHRARLVDPDDIRYAMGLCIQRIESCTTTIPLLLMEEPSQRDVVQHQGWVVRVSERCRQALGASRYLDDLMDGYDAVRRGAEISRDAALADLRDARAELTEVLRQAREHHVAGLLEGTDDVESPQG